MRIKLNETFTLENLLDNEKGIWRQLYDVDSESENPVFDWLSSDIALYLDNEYYSVHSGEKYISKIYERIIDFCSERFGEDDKYKYANDQIINIIRNKFANKWNRLYSAINNNYEPLENYNMVQTETPNVTKEKTVATNVTTETKDDVTETAINGFNSTNPVPQGKTTRNGSSTVSGNANDNVETETETGTRGLTRHGNIGVTTSQQMLQSEIDIRRNFNFFNEIMDDVDSILCLLVY